MFHTIQTSDLGYITQKCVLGLGINKMRLVITVESFVQIAWHESVKHYLLKSGKELDIGHPKIMRRTALDQKIKLVCQENGLMVLSFTKKCDILATDSHSIERNAVNAILMSSEAVSVFSAFIIYCNFGQKTGPSRVHKLEIIQGINSIVGV